MLTKRFLFIGAHLLLIILLLTSVAYSQFIRITGDVYDSQGSGYGYGYGVGYGWDGGQMVGAKTDFTYSDPDVFGYGYGNGFMSSDLTYSDGTLSIGVDNFIALVIGGAIVPIDIEGGGEEDPEVTVTGIRFIMPTQLTFGEIAIINIEADTTFTADSRTALLLGGNGMPTSYLTGTTTLSVSGLPTGYAAITDGAIQFGFPDMGLTVSPPISISIYVGSDRSGETLKVLRQSPGSSDWTLIANCTVSGEGLCTFTTTHLSSFTTATYTAPASTPTEEPSTSNSSGYIQLTSPTSNSVTITRTLRYGTYNSEVKKLQQLLKDLGYLKIKKTTTFFGLATRTALKKFQKEHGLKVTGIADLATRRALKNH